MYFCPVSCAEASIEADRVGNDIYRKRRLLYALFLAYRNFANSRHTAMNIAAVDSSGVCLYPHCIYALSRCIDTFEAYIYVSAWGFLSLLVQTVWAMRRPLYAGRVTVRSSPLFWYVCGKREDTINNGCSVWESSGTENMMIYGSARNLLSCL